MAMTHALALISAKLRRITRRWAALALAGLLAAVGLGMVFVGALIWVSSQIGPALAFASMGAGLVGAAALMTWARSQPRLAHMHSAASRAPMQHAAQASQSAKPAADLAPDLQAALLLGFAAACAVIDGAKDRKSGRR